MIGTAAVLVLGLGAFATQVKYDHNLLHLQARDLDAVRWETTLIEHTNGASWHALSTTNTPEEALALKARYEKLPEVSRVVEIASLVPREQDRKVVLLREMSLASANAARARPAGAAHRAGPERSRVDQPAGRVAATGTPEPGQPAPVRHAGRGAAAGRPA